ncbi:MAG: recombinase RecT [Phycisphaerae bacterium]
MTEPLPTTGRPRKAAVRTANSVAPVALPKNPTTAVPPAKVGMKAVRELLDKKIDSIRRAIPKGVQITAEGLISNAILQMEMAKDHKLRLCTPISVLYAVLAAASAGLDFIGDQAFLAAMSKKEIVDGAPQHSHYYATLIPGFRGYVTVAARFGWFLDCQDVREGDKIKIDMGSNTIVHEITLGGRGAVTGATCVLRRAADGRVFHVDVMDRTELDQIKTNHDSWKYHYAQMAKVAVCRRGFKFVPKDRYDARILEEIARRNDAEEELEPVFDAATPPEAGDDSAL